MYQEPIFLKPVFKERIWGGTKLRDDFGYTIPSEQTGECWGISAHPNGPSTILNGPLKGETLDAVWKGHRELFGHVLSEEFPLLVKILDAKTDLSVQVHPDDDYARNIEGVPFGKTECWYIVDCEPDAELVYGHHAESQEAFQRYVKGGEWDKLLRRVKVKPGEFYYVPSGTIHAIGGGVVILETQQSSDITYRVYDYDRTDDKGNTRELHLDQAIAVTGYPHQDPVPADTIEEGEKPSPMKRLITDPYFTVYELSVNGEMTLDKEEPFWLCSVIDGEGHIEVSGHDFSINKGDHFILPSTMEKRFSLKGKAKLIVSHP